MRAQLLVIVWLSACAPAGDVGVARQAVSVDPMPVAIGLSTDRLGTALASCPDGRVVAGVPGRNGYWLSDGGVFSGPTGGLGGIVACDGAPLIGGAGGLWRADGGAFSIVAGEVRCAAGRSGVAFVESGNSELLVVKLNGTSLLPLGCAIDAVRWVSASRLMVGCPTTGRVFLVDVSAAGGLASRLLFDGGVPQAGRSLASGDVWWQPGDELLVGAEQKVLVFDQDGGFITALHGTHPSFGAALEVTPSEYAVERVWVGEPDLGRIWSFIGDAGAPLPLGVSPPGFGAALAGSGSRVFIGAPADFSGRGAVYVSRPSLLVSTDSEARECSPATCPVTNCLLPDCVGGVVCVSSGLGLCADAGEDVDAGAVDGGGDAGAPDAGGADAGGADAGGADAGAADAGGADAGAADAGAADAGSADAGADPASTPIQFLSSGCSTGAAGPLLLLALALRRRR